MFYEERVIDGKLMFRNSPNGEWYGFTYEVLTQRTVAAEAREKALEHRLSTRPEALILKAVEACKQIADECDARADADALDQRSHFWGGGARQCQHAVQALVSPQLEPKK